VEIKFRISERWRGVFPEPQPASEFYPIWLKNLSHDVEVEKPEFPTGTAKRCMPVHDVVSAGYIIPLPEALHVVWHEDGNYDFNWRGDYSLISTHSAEQAPPYAPIFKFNNPWSISTPEGYSCLIIQPAHHPELPFEVLPAVVDTDAYHNYINFPFKWTALPYEDVLDEDVPMVQVIPFKRQEWKHSIGVLNDDEAKEVQVQADRIMAVNHGYKKDHRKRKVYK